MENHKRIYGLWHKERVFIVHGAECRTGSFKFEIKVQHTVLQNRNYAHIYDDAGQQMIDPSSMFADALVLHVNDMVSMRYSKWELV